MTDSKSDEIVVRHASKADVVHAVAAADLIEELADAHDVALRSAELLVGKIHNGRAVIALHGEELVGFGYWSRWQGGMFVSHSGLVVRPDYWNQGIGRRLKLALFGSSRAQLPHAILMSVTTSPQVKALNESLGFRVVSLDRLTTDPEFWEGCKTCRNWTEVQARGERCCCEGMILEPPQLG